MLTQSKVKFLPHRLRHAFRSPWGNYQYLQVRKIDQELKSKRIFLFPYSHQNTPYKEFKKSVFFLGEIEKIIEIFPNFSFWPKKFWFLVPTSLFCRSWLSLVFYKFRSKWFLNISPWKTLRFSSTCNFKKEYYTTNKWRTVCESVYGAAVVYNVQRTIVNCKKWVT